MGGKKKGKAPSREIQRFSWLIVQLKKKGTEQKEIAERTGMSPQYISALRRYETTGHIGIGAEIVRLMRDGMGIDPAYFYDDYEGERHHSDYSMLDKKREQVRYEKLLERVLAIESRQTTLEREKLEAERKLAAAQAELRKRPRPR